MNASISNSDSVLDQDNFYNNFAAPAVTSQADADKYFYTFESKNKDSRLGFDYKYGLNSKFNSSYSKSKLNYKNFKNGVLSATCLLYTSPSPRDATLSRMPSSA